jgi:hypothetical protein
MVARGGRSSIAPTRSCLRWGEWSASRPGRALPPGKGLPGTHWVGGLVGSRAGLDAKAGKEILRPCRRSNPGRPFRF